MLHTFCSGLCLQMKFVYWRFCVSLWVGHGLSLWNRAWNGRKNRKIFFTCENNVIFGSLPKFQKNYLGNTHFVCLSTLFPLKFFASFLFFCTALIFCTAIIILILVDLPTMALQAQLHHLLAWHMGIFMYPVRYTTTHDVMHMLATSCVELRRLCFQWMAALMVTDVWHHGTIFFLNQFQWE